MPVRDLIADPQFIALDPVSQRQVAGQLDPAFGQLDEASQDQVLGHLASQRLPELQRSMTSLPDQARQAAQPALDAIQGVREGIQAAPPGVGTSFAATVARVVPTVVGGVVAGRRGATIGAAAGGTLAQEIEIAAKQRPEFNLGRLAVDTAMGALPGTAISQDIGPAGQIALRAVEGGAFGGAAQTATNVSEGQPWSNDLGKAVGLGATVGGVAATAQMYRVQAIIKKATDQADLAARAAQLKAEATPNTTGTDGQWSATTQQARPEATVNPTGTAGEWSGSTQTVPREGINVYHGTGRVFDELNPNASSPDSIYGPGIYVTDSPAIASEYADAAKWRGQGRQLVTNEGELAKYFTPGKVVPSWNGQFDLVKKFNPSTANAGWSVNVVASDAHGNPISGARLRQHATWPEVRHEIAPNVRPMRLAPSAVFDVDASATPAQAEAIGAALAQAGHEGSAIAADVAATGSQVNGHTLYDYLATHLGDAEFKNKAAANRVLSAAGFDAIRYPGGKALGGATHDAYVVLNPERLSPEFNVVASDTSPANAPAFRQTPGPSTSQGTSAGPTPRTFQGQGAQANNPPPITPPGQTPPITPPLPDDLARGTVSNAAEHEVANQFKINAAETARVLAETDASQSGQRLFRQMAEAFSKSKPGVEWVKLQNGLELHVPTIAKAMESNNLSPADFMLHWADTVSSQGRGLNYLSQVQKALTKASAKDPGLRSMMQSMGAEDLPPLTFWGRVKQAGVVVDDLRRAHLTSQVATASRNLETQGATTVVEAADQAMDVVLRGGGPQAVGQELGYFAGAAKRAAGDNLDDVARLFGAKREQSVRTIGRALDDMPDEATMLLGNPTSETVLGPYTRVLGAYSQFQERFYRRAIFDARLRGRLAEAGADVPASLADPSTIPDEIRTGAIDDAMKATFARNPQKGEMGNNLMAAWKGIRPLATLINPFPRFMVNAYRFLTDHSPAGYLRLMGVNDDALLNASPTVARKTLAKAHIGTMLLAGGVALRNSRYAGDKWYQVKGDDGRTHDLRPFAPFSTFAFFGDVAKQLAETGSISMTTADFAQGLLSMNRIAGTGLVAVDLLRAGSMDRKQQMIGDVLNQYIGGFTVPFATIKDVVAQVDPQEAILRDTNTAKFSKEIMGVPVSLAPMMRNLPVVSQQLPKMRSPLVAGDLKQDAPLWRQFTGDSSRVKSTSESTVDRLAIESAKILPRTGVPEWDREVAGAVGQVMDHVMTPMVTKPWFLKLTPNEQRLRVDKLMGIVRADATRVLQGRPTKEIPPQLFQGIAPQPDLALQVYLKGAIDPDTRAVLEERGVDLSPQGIKQKLQAGLGR